MTIVTAFAPGRVNLVGDHTDYTGGLVLPMAVKLGTTFVLTLEPGSQTLAVTSAVEPGEVTIGPDDWASSPRTAGSAAGEPEWGRYVRAALGLAGERAPGGRAEATSTLPIGAGLSSSTAFFIAASLAFGAIDPPADHDGLVAAAGRCRDGEEAASGVPSGLMDQLACLGGRQGEALMIDCSSLAIDPIRVPEDAVFVVAHCGEPRRLATSAYAERRGQCEAAEVVIGPLAGATVSDTERLTDPLLRRRSRHVVSENARVRAMAEALRGGDLRLAGDVMNESHASLAGDFEVSTPALDSLVEKMRLLPSVHGARLTGAGFGGCTIALADGTGRDWASRDWAGTRHWVVSAAAGAWRRVDSDR